MKKDVLKSTGPRSTRKANANPSDHRNGQAGSIPHAKPKESQSFAQKVEDEGVDIAIDTPAPIGRSHFMPPPPTGPSGVNDDDLSGAPAANLAYEDLLANLVLPSKTPVVPTEETPPPESYAPPPIADYGSPFGLEDAEPSSSDDRTLVTENPLLAEEMETAAREGKLGRQDDFNTPVAASTVASVSPFTSIPPFASVPPLTNAPSPLVGAYAPQPLSIPSYPFPASGSAALNKPKSKLFYVVVGSILAIAAIVLIVLIFQLVFPDPPSEEAIEPTAAPAVAPSALPTQSTPAPAKPIAPSEPALAPVKAPVFEEKPKEAVESTPAVEVQRRPAKAKKPSEFTRPIRQAAPKPAISVPKKTKAKASTWADPFAN